MVAPQSASSVRAAVGGVFSAVMLALVTSTAAHPQQSVAEELRVNVHAGMVLLHGDASAAPGISVGYGAFRWFVPFLTFDRAPLRDGDLAFSLRHIDAGVRVHLRGAPARVVPVALIAVTWRSADYEPRPFLGDTMAVKITGAGPTIGGGVLYYLRPRIALEATAKWTGGRIGQITARGSHFDAGEDAIDDASLRLNVGLSWFPLPARRTRGEL